MLTFASKNRLWSCVENEIIGVQISDADAYNQQAVVVAEIDESIVVAVNRLKIQLTEIADAKMIKFNLVCVPGLLGKIKEHLLAHSRRKNKSVIGRASKRQPNLLQDRAGRLAIADCDIVDLCNWMAGRRV